MEKKQKVVIITTYFPPIQSIASNRMLAFARYLNKNIFDVSVITLDDFSSIPFQLEDVEIIRLSNVPLFPKAGFKRKSPVLLRKAKSFYNKLYNRFIFFQNYDWCNKAIEHTKKILKENENTILISSFAPVEAHLVALELKKLGFKFKWIADFRDEMSLNPYNIPRWQKKIEKLEQEILSQTDGLTTISDVFIQQFKELNKNNHKVKYQEVRNGYDFEYQKVERVKSDIFVVNYVGNIYASVDLKPFYSAVKSIIEKHKITNFKINLIGVGNSFPLPDYFKNYITKTDKISHQEAIVQMQNADFLLFILPNIGWKGVYSGKLFEYLGSRKPILALTDPEDVAAKLITDCNAGIIADSNHSEEIEKAFLSAYFEWKNAEKREFNIPLIEAHHRKNQVKKLEELIIQLQKN